MVWKDKHDVYILTNMHKPPTEGNFFDEYGKAQKSVTVTDYNQHNELCQQGGQNG
jgi:hypothetical protein